MLRCLRGPSLILSLLTAAGAVAAPSNATPRIDAQAFYFDDPVSGWHDGLFGAALASGDWNQDGVADFAIGTPGRRTFDNQFDDAGAVHIYDGTGSGMTHSQSLGGGENDAYGVALVSGRFSAAQLDWLLVGAGGREVVVNGATVDGAGEVYLLTYHLEGLAAVGTLRAPNPQVDEGFGETLAVGDFNGDGIEDVAIGMPRHDVTIPGPSPVVITNAGAIGISYGGDTAPHQVQPAFVFTREDFALQSSQAGELFGSVLAAGDFNGDGWDDLAIGSPWRDVNGLQDVGEVLLMEGGPFGLFPSATSFVLWDFDPAMFDAEQHFGSALAAGDFDRSLCLLGTTCRDDLAIGADNAPVPGEVRPGVVAIARGTASGLDATSTVFSRTDLPGLHTTTDEERFGAALLAAPLDDFPGDDLVIGATRARVTNNSQHGAIYLVPGAPGLVNVDAGRVRTLTSNEEYNQQSYGAALAAAHLDGNDELDLVVGIPSYPTPDSMTAGAVELLLRGAFFEDDFESGTAAGWSDIVP